MDLLDPLGWLFKFVESAIVFLMFLGIVVLCVKAIFGQATWSKWLGDKLDS